MNMAAIVGDHLDNFTAPVFIDCPEDIDKVQGYTNEISVVWFEN